MNAPDVACSAAGYGCHRKHGADRRRIDLIPARAPGLRARVARGDRRRSFDASERGSAERGDPRAIATFRNTVLGLPGESGGANVDKLYDRRGAGGPLAIEQITCAGVDVQSDSGGLRRSSAFTAQNAIVQVAHFATVIGDPRDDAVWSALTEELDTHRHAAPGFGEFQR